MAAFTIIPYINFQGRAREAMEFYHKALGGKLTFLTFNPDGPPKEAGPGDSIMHSMLEADGATLYGTDGMADYPPTAGDNMAVALSGSDSEKLTSAFNALADGGTIKGPLKEESWGATFGWLQDKYGINWMVNITKG